MLNGDIISEYYEQMKQLLSQSRVSFLIGAGCSLYAGLPLMDSLTQQICDKLDPAITTDEDQKRLLHTQ